MHSNQAMNIIGRCMDALLKLPHLENDIPIGGIAIFTAHERCAPPYAAENNIWDRHISVLGSGRMGCEFMDESCRAEQANHKHRGPTYDEANAHATWMADQLRGMEHDGKRMRWLGFIDGISCHSLLTVDPQGAEWIFGWVFHRLNNPNYTEQFRAHMLERFILVAEYGVLPLDYAIGFMQGFLWCAGAYSISEIRLMNATERKGK